MTSEDNATSWREKCIDKYGLQLLPESIVVTDDLQAMINDENTWQEYMMYRTKVENDYDSQFNDDAGYPGAILEKKWKDRLSSVARDVKMEEWLRHTKIHLATADWSCDGEPMRCDYHAVIFSPYAIPRAVKLRHHYYRRTYNSKADFACNWMFDLIRFDQKSNGDAIQREHAQNWPKAFDYDTSTPLYDADTEMEILCSNLLKDPPYWDTCGPNNDKPSWRGVEEIFLKNFTPTTTRRMKEWLFSFTELPDHVSDFDFVRFLFASWATPAFQTLIGSIGYEWLAFQSKFKKHQVVKSSNVTRVTWLEHQARLVTNALRDIDFYYEPYNELDDKGEWGENALDAREEHENESTYNGIDHESLYDVPWLMWDMEMEAKHGGNFSSHLPPALYSILQAVNSNS